MKTFIIGLVSSETGYQQFMNDYIHGVLKQPIYQVKFIKVDSLSCLRGIEINSFMIHYSSRDISREIYDEILSRIQGFCTEI